MLIIKFIIEIKRRLVHLVSLIIICLLRINSNVILRQNSPILKLLLLHWKWEVRASVHLFGIAVHVVVRRRRLLRWRCLVNIQDFLTANMLNWICWWLSRRILYLIANVYVLYLLLSIFLLLHHDVLNDLGFRIWFFLLQINNLAS
jgi:hypothetical protein